MRIRYNPEARPELAAWEYYIDEPEKLRGHWAEQFARRQPMVLELGCGKGGFLAQMAPAHPEKNYIALDVKSEMLVLAKRKAEEAYAAAGVPMDNFLILSGSSSSWMRRTNLMRCISTSVRLAPSAASTSTV